jgi:hypothetical protein
MVAVVQSWAEFGAVLAEKRWALAKVQGPITALIYHLVEDKRVSKFLY